MKLRSLGDLYLGCRLEISIQSLLTCDRWIQAMPSYSLHSVWKLAKRDKSSLDISAGALSVIGTEILIAGKAVTKCLQIVQVDSCL